MKNISRLTGSLAVLAVSLSLAPTMAQGAEVKNLIPEIEGDTQCIQSAERYFFTWMDYNDTMAALLERGELYDRESMKWEADFERRASWRQPEHRLDYIHIPLGRVDGEENTRFGAIPQGADIAVGYLHDWEVHDIYGWGSDHQPRVESVSEIVIKPEFSATIEYTNDIQMIAKGSISGTANAAQPWPQQGEHDAALTAIDINGKQHRLNVSARATAMPTKARSRSNSQSSTTRWSVSGGVSVSAEGPSANVGTTYEETETVSSSRSSSTSVPAIPGAVYNKDYSDATTKVVEIECGGVSRVSRAAQINGHFYTKSFARGGSVSSSGTHGVTNTLHIKVTCRPCEGRTGDPTGEPSDPTGTPHDPTGPITPSGDSGYGSTTTPDPFAPRDHGGVTVTPAQGGAPDPSSYWDNPIIKAGGCIYIDPRYLPPFVVPVEKSALGEPGFDADSLDPGLIPLIVPDESGAPGTEGSTPLVPFGYLKPESRIQPDPGSNLVTIDGGFRVLGAEPTEQDHFAAGATIKFQPGDVARIDGPYEIAPLDGKNIRVLDGEGIRVHQLVDENADDPSTQPHLHGQVVESLVNPGVLLFSGAADLERADPAVQSEVDLTAGAVRRVGGNLEVRFHADWADVPVVVRKSNDIAHWTDVAEFTPEPGGENNMLVVCPIDPAEGAAFFRASVVPTPPRLLQPLGPESLEHMILRVQLALAESPEQVDAVLASLVYPMFELNMQIRELTMLLKQGDFDPLTAARVEVQLHALRSLLREQRDTLDTLLGE